MPYRVLPARLRRLIPAAHGQRLFRNVFNSQQQSGKSESVAFASAWAALESAGYAKNEAGQWVKKADAVEKAKYRGRDVEIDKPFRLPAGSSKKFGVYVRAGDKVKRVTFGDPNMEIRRDDPEARANFRSRHSCDTAKDKTSARYWSCRMWENDISVSEMTSKRQVSDDAFTFPDEARARSVDMGLEGAIHVAQMDGNAVYMPGATHEDYLKAYESLAGIEQDVPEPSQDKSGLLATAITAIIGAVMKTEPIHIAEDARILKLDDEQRIVWGWASVSTKGGTLVVDRQGDVIEPAEMVKMANDFMLESRTGKSMHGGNRVGEFIHSLPLTNELAKALGIETDREGWIVGMKVYDEAVWADVKAGKYAGFSIGGRVREKEEIG